MKRLFASMMILVMLLCGSMNVVAAESGKSNGPVRVITEKTELQAFSDYIKEAQDNQASIWVHDAEGNDYTADFEQILDDKGIESAFNYTKLNRLSIQTRVIENGGDNSRANMTVGVADYVYQTGQDEGGVWGMKEWAVMIRGSYVYNVESDRIISAQYNTTEMYFNGFGALFTPTIHVTASSATVNTSTNTANFYIRYYITTVVDDFWDPIIDTMEGAVYVYRDENGLTFEASIQASR